MRTSRKALAGMGMALSVLAAGGCDQLPWQPKKEAAVAPPAAPAPSAPAIPDSERVAIINGTPLSTTDIELAIQELRRFVELSQQEWKPLPAEDRGPEELDLVDVLNSVAEAELKAQNAKARTLDLKTEIQRRKAYLDRNFYAQEWDRWQRARLVPTDDEIHAFYESNKAGFAVPELIRVRQIVASSLADAEAVRAKAVQGSVFAQLAIESSIGAGKDEGGDVGWHVRGQDAPRLVVIDPAAAGTTKVFFPQLEQVAFALEPEQISQPVKGPDGYYVVQVVERKPEVQKSELETRDAIRAHLTEVAIRKALEDLRKSAKIQEFPGLLTGVQQ